MNNQLQIFKATAAHQTSSDREYIGLCSSLRWKCLKGGTTDERI